MSDTQQIKERLIQRLAAPRIMEVRQRYESESKSMRLKLEAGDVNARVFTLIGQNLVRLDHDRRPTLPHPA